MYYIVAYEINETLCSDRGDKSRADWTTAFQDLQGIPVPRVYNARGGKNRPGSIKIVPRPDGRTRRAFNPGHNPHASSFLWSILPAKRALFVRFAVMKWAGPPSLLAHFGRGGIAFNLPRWDGADSRIRKFENERLFLLVLLFLFSFFWKEKLKVGRVSPALNVVC